MPTVRFVWSPFLVAVRREACPAARWIKAQKAWEMSDADAQAFLAASHNRLSYVREYREIAVDQQRWLVGFVQGAPKIVSE